MGCLSLHLFLRKTITLSYDWRELALAATLYFSNLLLKFLLEMYVLYAEQSSTVNSMDIIKYFPWIQHIQKFLYL